jgi:CHAD domain-containing protein
MAKRISIAWDAKADARVNARRHLPGLAEEYFRVGRKAVGGTHGAKAMHKLRLRTKHFRYTLELFRDVYGAGLEKRLEMLKPVQDALGDLNDCASARELLGNGARKMNAYLKEREQEKMAEFEAYWRGVFDAPGESEEWMKYLGADGRSR